MQALTAQEKIPEYSFLPAAASRGVAHLQLPGCKRLNYNPFFYQADSVGGHCGDNYPASCLSNSRRAKSIDVNTGGPSGESVVLPSLEGKIQQWIYVNRLPNILSGIALTSRRNMRKHYDFLSKSPGIKKTGLFIWFIWPPPVSSLGKFIPPERLSEKTSATHVILR